MSVTPTGKTPAGFPSDSALEVRSPRQINPLSCLHVFVLTKSDIDIEFQKLVQEYKRLKKEAVQTGRIENLREVCLALAEMVLNYPEFAEVKEIGEAQDFLRNVGSCEELSGFNRRSTDSLNSEEEADAIGGRVQEVDAWKRLEKLRAERLKRDDPSCPK